ncbi:nidogen-1-like [Oryzias melastigma]|uniref:nidogen-1-like n=1 Tax=Oryzias melastigma TaxID=30732 RepID=UPI000CF7C663|nr:nidogen-1-like [Oryzias melastigma]
MKTEEARPLLHIPDRVVIAVAYDCVDRMVYWTDITGPAISKASLSGGDIIPVVTKGTDDIGHLWRWTYSCARLLSRSRRLPVWKSYFKCYF